MYFLNNFKIWKAKLLCDPWGAEWMLCEQLWKQQETPCTSPLELLGGHMYCQWAVIFWKESFWAVGLNSELKITSKPCCKQRCCHPGFVVPLTEHRWSKFSIILKGPRIFGMINEHWLQLQVTSFISPYQESPLNLEVRHWLLLCSYESPRWHPLPIEGCFIYTENLFSVATLMNYLS